MGIADAQQDLIYVDDFAFVGQDLLDEPTTGLDVMSTRAMRGFIRRLKEEGKCVLFSSHIMQEVSALCERIVVIAHGRVVADGPKDEVLQRLNKGEIRVQQAG